MDEVEVKLDEVSEGIEIKLIKLDNNDLIIAQLSENSYDEYDLFMIDPVHVQTHQLMHRGRIIETYSLKPWIPLSNEFILEVPYDKILNISSPSDGVIDRYIEFLTEEEEYDGFSDEPETTESNEDMDDAEDDEIAEMLELKNTKPTKPTLH
jgi:hypothetical protein